MTPLLIDPLFAACPEFFAHQRMADADRRSAAAGDWVKVVFELPDAGRKQVWLVVESADTNRPGEGYVGRLAPWGHGTDFELLLPGEVAFTSRHVYRLLRHQP
jgi:hypothetical protein